MHCQAAGCGTKVEWDREVGKRRYAQFCFRSETFHVLVRSETTMGVIGVRHLKKSLKNCFLLGI